LQSNNKLLKISLLILTIILFAGYYLNNRESFVRISDLSAIQVFLIFTGQSLVLLANTITLYVIVSFFHKRIHPSDAARVTAYSSLINFFGFLQGGVGFRGIYLKKYFSIQLKKYALITTVQYLLLLGSAGLLVLIGVGITTDIRSALLLASLITLGLLFLFLGINKLGVNSILPARFEGIGFVFHSRKIFLLGCSVTLQLLGSLIAYGVALDAIGAHLTVGGLLVFTGISQFSIIIALTPGALGIREGLLLIAQNQMLLTTGDIIVASTIDRIVYFITLALLVPLALNVRSKLGLTEAH
jgi:uncharacterized membrane protein YbhN (UPF0104 family)